MIDYYLLFLCYILCYLYIYIYLNYRYLINYIIIIMNKKDKKELTAKIVIIGDIGVGKSSITIRYVFDKFDLNQ